MKNTTLFCIALLFFYAGFSQTYTEGADEKLQLLNKSAVTTSILYDRVYPGANLVAFNQTAVDTSAVHHFYQGYAELQTADYLERWNPLATLQSEVALQTDQDKIPIGILNVDFEHLDELAFQDNLVAVQGADSLLADVPARPRSPWLKKTALVVSPLAVHTNSTAVTFVTGPAFKTEEAATTITAIEADFNNGQGWQLLPQAGELNVSFTSPGPHHIHFKISLSNGDTRYTYAGLKVYATPPVLSKSSLEQKAAAESDCFSGLIVSSRTFQGYNEGQAYSGAGHYQAYLGGAELDNPVIVVDGFDPLEGEDEGTDLNDIYNKFLRYNNVGGNLGDDLTALGYDIIPLNFVTYVFNGKMINGGTDYVERNAMVLIDLIEQVNSCKVGGNPIKIIGFSMGGLVARYALRYMELNGIPHDTDLFVSVDTPHKGAVVPIGVQELVNIAGDVSPETGKANALLHSPAARQMLIHHVLADSQTPQGAPGFHQQFYTALNAMGFPQQTRNIAVVNGTANGTPINTPGQQYVDADAAGGLLGLGAKASAKLHYTPDRGATQNIIKFKLKLRLLFVNITTYSRTRQATTPAVTGSYENTPGGFFDVTGLTHDFLGDNGAFLYSKGTLTSLLLHIYILLQNPDFSFIPVKSALAFNGAEEDLYEDFSARNLACTGETPFHSYYIPPENQQHTALTGASANFITQEILGNPQEPNLNVEGDNIITGPPVVCDADTVFNLRDCSVNDVTWSVSPNLQIVNVLPNAVTVRAIDNTTKGFGSISATFAGQAAMEKEVYVGRPQTPAGSITGPATVVTGALVNYQGSAVAGATSYKWHLPHPYQTVENYDYSGQNWQMYPTTANSLQAFTGFGKHAGNVQFMGENACGCGGAKLLYVTHAGAGGGAGGGNGSIPKTGGGGIPKAWPAGGAGVPGDAPVKNTEHILLYPNPADKNITLQLLPRDAVQPAAPRNIYSIHVMDRLSRKAAAVFFSGEGKTTTTVDIAHLAPGYYTVIVKTDTGSVVKKLLVN